MVIAPRIPVAIIAKVEGSGVEAASGVMVKENYVEKGTKVGPLRLSKSKKHFVGGATMVFNEAGLQKKIASLRNSAVYDVTAYEKSLEGEVLNEHLHQS